MKFAVTGSSGFIGQSLIRMLSNLGYDFLSLSRRPTKIASPYHANSRCVDYSDRLGLGKVLRGCDIVIHLAGLAHQYISPSDNPSQIYRAANVDPLISLAIAAAEANVKKFIYISSIGVLGSPTPGLPFADDTIPSPKLYYSKSKLEAEICLKRICALSSMPFVILRPPLVYGPNCPGNLARLIKLIQLLPILPFGSLCGRRSFLSVDHLVDMIIVSAFSAEIVNSAYVLSDSVDLPLREVFLALISGLGRSSHVLVDFSPLLLSGATRLIGKYDVFTQLSSELLVDSSRFRQVSCWHPFRDPFEELRLTASSFRH